MWLDQLKMSRYERMIGKTDSLPPEMSSLLAGSARAVRLSVDYDNTAEEGPVHVVAAGVVAPMVLLYTWWILRDAHAKGLKRLYFLARDGLIFHSVAKLLADRWKLDIELRYLYCSRESLLLPSFQNLDDFERYWISWGYLSTITLDEICGRINLEPGEILKFFSGEGNRPDSSEPLDKRALEQILRTLDRSEVKDLIQNRNHKIFENTIGYLAQEGLCSNDSYALVDTGWKGTSQYALSSILERAGEVHGGSLSGYYLGLNDNVFRYKGDSLYPFLFDWTRSARDYRLYNFLCFEMLFAANHGRTRGYIENDGVFQPELCQERYFGCDWIIEIHHKTAQEYAKHIARFLDFTEFPQGGSHLCRQLMRQFISTPDPYEALVYGDYPIASEIRERDMQKMAPEMSRAEFLRIVGGLKKIKGYWPQASFVRSGLKVINFGYGIFLDMKLLEIYRRFFLKY